MSRQTRLVLLGLTLVLGLAPLVVPKPGMPMVFKSDEPAYYLMALSLARDGDLRCEPRDLRRLFDAYPYDQPRNLILMTDDGWNTVYFGKPYLYSLFAAPATALFGPNGMMAFNMLLLLGMVWMGTAYLGRYNDSGIAALFAAGFFLLSAGFAYVFWLQPEIFNMAAVTAALYLAFHEPATGPPPGSRWRRLARRAAGPAAPLCSGAALVLGAYHKPMLAAFALPALWLFWRRQRLRGVVLWVLGAALSLGLAAGLATALTGHPSAYLGVARSGFSVEHPDRMPVEPVHRQIVERDPQKNSWRWLWHLPRLYRPTLFEDLGYFLWGRHTGLLLYAPFSLLAVLLFLAWGRRSAPRWLTLAALVAVGLFFVLWIPFNWHGGGGFVGNRYFINAYPGFLFLVTRIRPAWATLLGFGAGGLFIGPLLLSPYGAVVPEPTLQAHTRAAPFGRFPLELTLERQVPGYRGAAQAGVWFWARQDLFRPRGDELWLLGGRSAELLMQRLEPLPSAVFEVRNQAPENTVELELGGQRHRLRFPAEIEGMGETRRVEFEAPAPYRVRRDHRGQVWVYRLAVRTATGQLPALRPGGRAEGFYLGAALLYLGSREELARDLYQLRWGRIRAPAQVAAGEHFTLDLRLWNTSEHPWPAEGATRVNLSYHWLGPAGERRVWDGLRTGLPRDVPPGGQVRVELRVRAPAEPGDYRLVLDPVRERVAWFSERNAGLSWETPVEVLAGEAPPAPATADSPAP